MGGRGIPGIILDEKWKILAKKLVTKLDSDGITNFSNYKFDE